MSKGILFCRVTTKINVKLSLANGSSLGQKRWGKQELKELTGAGYLVFLFV